MPHPQQPPQSLKTSAETSAEKSGETSPNTPQGAQNAISTPPLGASADEAARLWKNYQGAQGRASPVKLLFYVIAGVSCVLVLVAGLYIVAFR